MSAKRTKKRLSVMRGRIVGNTGGIALVECTDDNYIQIVRGWTPGAEDMFRDEFQAALRVGRELRVTTNGSACSWEVVTK